MSSEGSDADVDADFCNFDNGDAQFEVHTDSDDVDIHGDLNGTDADVDAQELLQTTATPPNPICEAQLEELPTKSTPRPLFQM